MNKPKHYWIITFDGRELCERCGCLFNDAVNVLYIKNGSWLNIYLPEETYGEYISRMMPCLTDEELIIKKIIE